MPNDIPNDAVDPEAEALAKARRKKRRRAKARQALRAQEAEQQRQPKPVQAPVAPAARPAKAKARHYGIVFSFLIMVALPVGAASWYLYTRAADQYASTLGFVVRTEDVSSAIDVFSGLSGTLGGGGQHDSDILYEFIRSAQLVRQIDDKLDLRAAFSKHYDTDPLMGYDPEGTIEDLTAYWQRAVRISYDTGSGLIEVRALAFDPITAQQIAQEIFSQSSEMINNVSAIAREDSTRYARQDLELAVERLKDTREALTAFRLANQIVDPSADIQGQMGLLNTLQTQLADALIEFDVLSQTTREGDPRLEQARNRIDVIQVRIDEERRKFGVEGQGPGGETYAQTISEFERLTVDREFAESAYAAAQASYDGSRAEANRQSRYLAAYIKPTQAEKSEFPQRELLIAIIAMFSFLIWTISTLIFYALRDRR